MKKLFTNSGYKFLALLVALTLAFGGLPVSVFADEGLPPDGDNIVVATSGVTQDDDTVAGDEPDAEDEPPVATPATTAAPMEIAPMAAATEWNGGTQGVQTITEDITVTGEVTVTGMLTIDGNVTISGGGTLKRSFSGNLISVPNGATLTLESITIDGDKNGSFSYGGGSLVTVGGTLIMNSGAKLQNNTYSDGPGGGVLMEGTFTMYGGEISGNTASGGGGVNIQSSGTFTMYGGKIKSNTSTDRGGGIDASGDFIMNGGEISDNECDGDENGGGVWVWANNYVIIGGDAVIKNNTSGSVANNLFLCYDYITIGTGANGADAPTCDMEIHVTLSEDNPNGNVIVQSGANDTIKSYFTSDYATKQVVLDGEALKLEDVPLTPITNTGGSATTTYAGTIDLTTLASLFTVDTNAGARTYTVEAGGSGTGTIGGDNKTLTVTTAGTFTIGLETAATATHAAGAKVTATLTVNKATPSGTWPTGLTATYGQDLSAISLTSYTALGGVAGAFTWTTPTDNVGNVGSQSHNMTFTPNVGTNYNNATQNVNVTVSAKTTTFIITAIGAQTYTGSQIRPTVEVKDGATVLALGTDYSVSYGANVNVADGGSVSVIGAGNYAGSSGNATFTITPKALTDVTVTQNGTLTYNGSQRTAVFTVQDGGVTLTAGTDYTLTNHQQTNAGTSYTATITGTGNYSGTVNGSFAVTKASLKSNDFAYTAPANLVYDGGTKAATVNFTAMTGKTGFGTIDTVTYIGTGSTSYSSSTTAPTDVGTYAVRVTTTGATNYIDAANLQVGTFTITAAPIPTGGVGGDVSDTTGKLAGVIVEVRKGGTTGAQIGSTTTNQNGAYSFSGLPYGVYSLVATVPTDGRCVTTLIKIESASMTENITMPTGNQNTVVEIVGSTPPVAVENLNAMFTSADETIAAQQGASVEIKLVVQEISNPADANIVLQNIGGKTLGFYLDAQLLKTITGTVNDDVTDEPIQPPQGTNLTIVIDVPPELQNMAPYSIIRVHNGVAATIPATYDSTLHTLTFEADKFSTYALAYTPKNPKPPTPPSNGGGSSSSGGSDGGTGSTIVSTYWIEVAEAKAMAKTAKQKELDYVRSYRATITGIRKNALLALTGLRYQHDTVANNAVQVRVYVSDTSKATKDILVSGYVTGNAVDTVKAKFEKWFANKLAVVSLEQQGNFGMQVQIAAKVDLTGIDTNNLYFYSYDKATNKFKRILTEYRIDSKGYLHFATVLAGSIVISDRPLGKDAQTATPVKVTTTQDLQNPNTGGDGDFSLPIQIDMRNPITGGDSSSYMDVADTPLKLEKADIQSAGKVLMVDLDAPLIQNVPNNPQKGGKPSALIIGGIAAVILIAAMVLWAIVPHRGDKSVSALEHKKTH